MASFIETRCNLKPSSLNKPTSKGSIVKGFGDELL